MLSRPLIVVVVVIMQNSSLMHEGYKEQYVDDPNFQNIYHRLSLGNENENIDFHMHDGLLYHLGKLYIPKGERNDPIREDHTYCILGHFGVGKTLANLQRYCYWPKMQENVSKYIRGCMLCNVSKPSNKKLGLYMPFSFPIRPWENISMDFVRGLPIYKEDMIIFMWFCINLVKCAY